VRLPGGVAFETAARVWHKPITAKARPKGENVVDLMNALKRASQTTARLNQRGAGSNGRPQPDKRKCCCQSARSVLRRLRRTKTASGVKSPETSMTSYYRFFEMKVAPCFGLAFALAAWSDIVGPIWRSPYRLRNSRRRSSIRRQWDAAQRVDLRRLPALRQACRPADR
jgi:hypothetical protein